MLIGITALSDKRNIFKLSRELALAAIARVIMLSKAVIIVLIFPCWIKGLFLKHCHSYEVKVNYTGRDFKRYLAIVLL
jgi:hypothetical protein